MRSGNPAKRAAEIAAAEDRRAAGAGSPFGPAAGVADGGEPADFELSQELKDLLGRGGR